MVKGDDAVAKRRNKARRKSQSRDGTSVSARVASIIASKKRRQTGVRRKCEGMCFSLPSPEDPFNDNHGKVIAKMKKSTKKVGCSTDKVRDHDEPCVNWKKDEVKDDPCSKISKLKNEIMSENNPSKFMGLCMNSIEFTMRATGKREFTNVDAPLFADPWGFEFLKSHISGRNVLDTGGCCCTLKQIAWLASVAADSMSRKEKDGSMCSNPYLLFLVPSRDDAARVRSVFKCLKEQGFHTVSIHSDASIDHQIVGLEETEPEFVVSTPERLLELMSRGAIDVSNVSFLVVDEAETEPEGDFLEKVNAIAESIRSKPFTVVFGALWHTGEQPVFQNLLPGPVSRITSSYGIDSLGAFIYQPIEICVSDHEKLSKSVQALRQLRETKQPLIPSKALFVIKKSRSPRILMKMLLANNFSFYNDHPVDSSNQGEMTVAIMNDERVMSADLSEFEAVFVVDFVDPDEIYAHILAKMCRHAATGVLLSFLTEEDGVLAAEFVCLLKQCGREVPSCLWDLHVRSLQK